MDLRIPLQLRFGDEDSYGHVNNVRYLQFFEDARFRLTHSPLGDAAPAGFASSATFWDVSGPDCVTLAVRHEIEYLKPLYFRTAPIYVDIRVTGLGRSSFELGYSIGEQDGSQTYAVAASSMVMADRDSGKPVGLTPVQRDILTGWLGEPVTFRGSRR
jgi:acyl-CoA thioester hydrolase